MQKKLTKWNHDFRLSIAESNILAVNRTVNAPETQVAPTHTKKSNESFNVAKREWQRSSRTR